MSNMIYNVRIPSQFPEIFFTPPQMAKKEITSNDVTMWVTSIKLKLQDMFTDIYYAKCIVQLVDHCATETIYYESHFENHLQHSFKWHRNWNFHSLAAQWNKNTVGWVELMSEMVNLHENSITWRNWMDE